MHHTPEKLSFPHKLSILMILFSPLWTPWHASSRDQLPPSMKMQMGKL